MYSGSKIRKIKERETPNDKFYTPDDVVDVHYSLVNSIKPFKDGDCIYEPFAGKHAYIRGLTRNFPNLTLQQYSTEIDEGTDFFQCNKSTDYIITNPPYSILTKVMQHMINLKPKLISLLINSGSLSIPRLNLFEKNNYKLVSVHFLRVENWFGVSMIATWVLNSDADALPKKEITYSSVAFKDLLYKK